MQEPPEVPPPVAKIPATRLWVALAAPVILTFIGNVIVGNLRSRGTYGEEFLIVPVVMFFVVILFAIHFGGVVGARYRGRSLVFLNLGYLFGQAILCLGVWFGSCFLFVS